MPTTLYFEHLPSTPIGPIAMASTDAGILAVEIGITDLASWAAQFEEPGTEVVYKAGPIPAAGQLSEYLSGRRRAFTVPLDLSRMRDFQRSVLEKVLAVPYGETRTYAEIAAAIGREGAYRAVGRANATNPIAIVIPCHRLVGADGSLRGYGAPGGIETKAWLLDLERGGAV